MSESRLPQQAGKPSWLLRHFKRIGVLRTAWAVGIIFTLVCAPFARVDADHAGWMVVTSLVAPVLVILSIFVLLLDNLMCLVFSLEKPAEERHDYRYTMRWNWLLLAVLILAWLPFASAVVGG